VLLVCTASHPFDLDTCARVLIGNEAVISEHNVHGQEFLNYLLILGFNSTDVMGCSSTSEQRMEMHILHSVMLPDQII
jgi:hypothetical protein